MFSLKKVAEDAVVLYVIFIGHFCFSPQKSVRCCSTIRNVYWSLTFPLSEIPKGSLKQVHPPPPGTNRITDSGAVEEEGFLGQNYLDACSAVRACSSVRGGALRDARPYS